MRVVICVAMSGAVAPPIHMMMMVLIGVATVTIIIMKLLLVRHFIALVAERATRAASALVCRLVLIHFIDLVMVAPMVAAMLGVS